MDTKSSDGVHLLSLRHLITLIPRKPLAKGENLTAGSASITPNPCKTW